MIIYDNVGCSFDYINDKLTILGPLPGYLPLTDDHIGSQIPYLARNTKGDRIDFEVGVADVTKDGLSITISNRKISASSNNNNPVNFSHNGNKQFYLFVNSANFNTAFNNVEIKNTNFDVATQKTTYFVDFKSCPIIIAKLPSAIDNKSLEISFKTIGHGSLIIRYGKNFSITLDGDSRYTKVVSTGDNWIELKDHKNDILGIQSNNDAFATLSDPEGPDHSFQYKVNATDFNGANIFWDSVDNKLLFGDSDSSNSKSIIPSSGNYPVIFNQTRDGSDFIVYGTGNSPGYPEKNLYFSNSGKLGINIPSGLKPATVMHIVNTLCKEGIRLENRASCYPADITLYQNPISTPTSSDDNVIFAQVTFAAKNSSNVKRNFAQIAAKRKSVSSSKGELQISVSDTNTPAESGIVTISTNPDQTTVNHGLNYLNISKTNSELVANNSRINISNNSIGINAGLTTNIVNVTGSVLINNELKLNYINQPNSLLAIDINKRIIAATGFEIPGIHDSFWPYEPNNNATKIGGKDLTWERYQPRSIKINELCLTASLDIELTSGAPIEEFVMGDQVAIYNTDNKTTQYRKIIEITVSADTITGFKLDESILLSGNLTVYSLTRGGIITNKIYSSGIVSDATDIVLSTRPNISTAFNSKNKNIDFLVYGTESSPAFSILANASLEDKASGIYFEFATQSKDYLGVDIIPFASKIGANGDGDINNIRNNAANYREAAETSIWPHRVSSVGTNGRPSFYGTYDQNGNVHEWVEDDNKILSADNLQYICGGSWRTATAEELRGYMPILRSIGLDDVGFRIVSQAGFYNTSVEELLDLRFVRVDHPNNLPDSRPLYDPAPVIKNNLGVVNYSYNISDKEITNYQYVKFLNSVAVGVSPIGLYKNEMTSSNVGGIVREGDGTAESPYIYSVKPNMNDCPVVFVDYLSAIRFINWLSNGSLSGNDAVEKLENGSYSIQDEIYAITKNRNRGYYLPSLNEWHKAAYYLPISETLKNPTSAIIIKTDIPHEYASGQISALTINGHLYTDQLKVGSSGNRFIETIKSGEYFNMLLGPDDVVYDENEVTETENYYRSFISNTGMQFATTGNITFINKDSDNPLNITYLSPDGVYTHSKIVVSKMKADGTPGSGVIITPSGFSFLDEDGDVISGGSTRGPNGGFVYKDVDTDNLFASNIFSVEKFVTPEGTGYYPKISGTPNNSIIHNDTNGHLSASDWFTVGSIPDGATLDGDNVVSIFTSDPELSPATLCVNEILIGPILPTFSGSILTHNGTSPAIWERNDYLKADGVSWNRTPRRAVKLVGQNTIQFVNVSPAQGGTGDVSLEQIELEFKFTDTIAIYNLDREVYYFKVAQTELVQQSQYSLAEDSLWDTANNRTNLILNIVPPLPESWLDEENKETTSAGDIILAYVFSVQNGAYLNMEIEPDAITAFDKEDIYEDEGNLDYPITRFKPSTANTISIRPGINTTFNKTAADIDFVIYGYRQTLLNRYEPDLFGNDESLTPSGLLPAFRVHSYVPNSFIGSISSGIFRETIANIEGLSVVSGVIPDINSKITINLSEPYKIATLEDTKIGIVNRAETEEENRILEKEFGFEIPIGGVQLSGSSNVSSYADLSIGGYTYSKGVVTNELVLTPLYSGPIPVTYELSLTQRLYVPNYPLTVNGNGQIISLIPPSAPRIPNSPTNVIANGKNASVELIWDAPVDNGGSEITAYVIEYSLNGGETWTTYGDLDSNNLPVHPDKNTEQTVEDLINGQSYIFRIYALNQIGKGDYSEVSNSVAPRTSTPTAPRNILVDGDNSGQIRENINITLSWTVPANIPAGTSIINYEIEYLYDNGTSIDQQSWNQAGISTTTFINIQNIAISPYVFFRVRAVMSSEVTPGDGIYGLWGVYRSPGIGIDPRLVIPPIAEENTDYNFGTFIFTGSCS